MTTRSSRRGADRLLLAAVRTAALASAAIVLLVVLYLVFESWPALRALGPARFLLDRGWHPLGGVQSGEFGLAPMLVGTLAATVGAMLVAGPLGVLSAAFARFYAPPRLGAWYRRMIEVMAGVPSVVFGLWGLTTIAPWIRRLRPPGTSLLAGILVLAAMIVPTVALLADAAFRNAPREELQGAAALSLSRFGTLRATVLPHAREGLWAAVVLGTMRAIGETMAVLMVCGNVAKVPTSVFDPVRTLTANIALELGYATAAHRAALFVSGLALMVAVALLVGLGARLRRGLPGA